MANNDVSIRLTASDKTREAFDSVRRNLDGISNASSRIGSLLSTVGIGAGLSVAGFTAFAKSGIDAADSLNDMSTRLGVSVKDLASLKLAAEQSGTSLDSIGTGIARLSKSIGEAEGGNKQLAQALQSLGITARDPKEAFFQLADAVQRIEDPNKRAALLAQVLGKSYGELVPLLAQGSDALRESAKQSETFAEAMARLAPNADRFNDQLALLKSNAAAATAQGLIPLVEAMNRVFDRFSKLSQLRDAGASLFDIVTGTVSANSKTSLDNVQAKIASITADIERLRRNSGGNDGSIGILQTKLDELKKVRSALIGKAVGGIQAIPERARKTATGGSDTPLNLARTSASKSVADPLAGLLAQTDIGKMQAFDKQVALLNQRFDSGRKNTELYTQAMTRLVQTTFADNWKQAADDAEFFRMVEADGIKTTQAWKQSLDDLANVDMGRLNDLLSNTDFARLQGQQQDMVLLSKAFSEGIRDADGNLRKLSESEYLDAVRNRLGLVGDAAKDAGNSLSEMAAQAGRNIQDAFAEFLFNPFDKGLKGMIQSFGQTIQKMVAQAIAADLAKRIFKWGDSGGGAGSVLGSIASAVFGGARASGGPVLGGKTYLVGEKGPELFTPGTGGSITPNNAIAGHTINVYVSGTNNAPDVRRAAGQGAREAYLALQGAGRYV